MVNTFLLPTHVALNPNPFNLVQYQHALPLCLCSWPDFRSDPNTVVLKGKYQKKSLQRSVNEFHLPKYILTFFYILRLSYLITNVAERKPNLILDLG